MRLLNRGLSGTIKWLFLLFVLLTIMLPIGWIVISAFKTEVQIIRFPPHYFATEVVLKNFITLFKRAPVLLYIRNTVIYVVLLTLGQLIVDTMAAYAFARMSFKGRHFLFTVLLAAMMIPFQVIMIPLFIELSAFRMVNTYYGLVIPRLVSVTGIFMLRAYFATLPAALEEAGRIDGLREFGIFILIMLPLCMPVLITHAVLSFNMGWNDLLYPLLMTSSIEKRMLANGLANFVGTDSTEYGPAFAGAVVSIVPALMFYVFGQKYFVNSIVSSGIKE